MFQYQIDSMRETINRLLRATNPPQRVAILREHAEFLGIDFHYSKPLNEVRPSGLVAGVAYGSVAMVKLADVFTALQNAVGIDEQRQSEEPSGSVGETQAENADND
jgi:hypothetical protein